MNPKQAARLKRKQRIRRKLSGSEARPRLSVFRSARHISRHIYAQIIDDGKGQTLVTASPLSGELKDKLSGLKKADAAKEVGKLLAAKAREKGISQVVFDRNGFIYHGRVKAVADSCRENGLKF
ncbi:MAG: 50S ribosomal protein L18 [Deltaproteobacteria bacterium]|nr:50S ribosomal protein L18 [Deltaproteobacteria bacterium]